MAKFKRNKNDNYIAMVMIVKNARKLHLQKLLHQVNMNNSKLTAAL